MAKTTNIKRCYATFFSFSSSIYLFVVVLVVVERFSRTIYLFTHEDLKCWKIVCVYGKKTKTKTKRKEEKIFFKVEYSPFS